LAPQTASAADFIESFKNTGERFSVGPADPSADSLNGKGPNLTDFEPGFFWKTNILEF
jgi:hypothetical protein